MYNLSKICLINLILGSILPVAQAHDVKHTGYLHDTADKLVLDSRGDCIRITYWTVENSINHCEGVVEPPKPVDSDNDGVNNNADQCPGTATGVMVDNKGCDKDSDNDGVADSSDKCLATPVNVSVNADGCAIDYDNDGIANYLDKCPASAVGTAVNSVGCAQDSDNDGIIDQIDQCPTTKIGIMVNAVGCAKDSDNDGVSDDKDQCPTTQQGVLVNALGCDKDSDNDGVSDAEDQCPTTQQGVSVNALGCDKDSDNDGVSDSSDQCPSSPAGISVDSKGCTLDSDNDGIADSSDSCPGSDSGAVVDSSGCKLTKSISLESVLFSSGTANITGSSQNNLEQVLDVLKENEHLSFEIAGHTDSAGNYGKNVKLSENRAQAVRQFLIDNGIAPERLTAKGYGPDQPLATNDTKDGRSKNRRVELKRVY
jgi:OmpA-OmpF porin, OOP family